MKRAYVDVKHCNAICPHFCHSYEDGEAIWCLKLRKIVYPPDDGPIFNDYTPRPIPTDCPLEDV
jgi:hypothetical protein